MASQSLRDAFRAFTTTCALITTDGPHGPNVMAAEWTFNVSYHPFLILVSIDPGNRTHDMILEAKEFGVNLVSEEQVAAMAFAGHYSKSDTDKLSSELFETVPARKIRAPMIRGALLRAECRLVQAIPMGDHTGFLGEVVEFSVDPEARPVVLHHGSRQLGERVLRRPGLVLTATPMDAPRGAEVVVAGELTQAGRPATPLAIELRGPNGDLHLESRAESSFEGSFRIPIRVPANLTPGAYRVTARSTDAEGHARIRVT